MIDIRVKIAVDEAAKKFEQSPAVAARINSWLEALSEGNTEIHERDDTRRRCEMIYDAVTIPDAQINEES